MTTIEYQKHPSRNGHRQPSELLDRQPPSDESAEKWVVASVLCDPRKWEQVKELLRARDFFYEPWRVLYSELVALERDGQPVDIGLLQSRMDGDKRLQDIGGMDAVLEAMRSLPTCENAKFYAGIVRDKAVLRNTINAALEAIQEAYSGDAKPADVLVNLQDRLAAAGAERGGKRFNAYGMAELLDQDLRVEWVAKGALVAQQNCIVGGSSKSMKTSITCDLAVSAAAAVPFLGRFDVARQHVVGFMSGESGLRVIRETLLRVCKARDVDARGLGRNLIVSDSVPQLANPVDVEGLRQFVRANGVEILALDPCYLALASDKTDFASLFSVGRLLGELSHVCAENKTTLVLVHHLSKPAARSREVPELTDLSHAGFGEHARQWLLLSRSTKYAGDGLHKLWLSIGGSAGHGSQWELTIDEGLQDEHFQGREWNVSLSTLRDAKREAEQDALNRKAREQEVTEERQVDRLVEAYRRFPQGATARELKEMANLRDNFHRANHVLIQRGDVQACDVAKGNGRTYSGFMWVKR